MIWFNTLTVKITVLPIREQANTVLHWNWEVFILWAEIFCKKRKTIPIITLIFAVFSHELTSKHSDKNNTTWKQRREERFTPRLEKHLFFLVVFVYIWLLKVNTVLKKKCGVVQKCSPTAGDVSVPAFLSTPHRVQLMACSKDHPKSKPEEFHIKGLPNNPKTVGFYWIWHTLTTSKHHMGFELKSRFNGTSSWWEAALGEGTYVI